LTVGETLWKSGDKSEQKESQMNVSNEINREVRWSIALSVLMILAGLLAVVLPEVSGIAITFLVAWLMIVMGCAHLVYTWHRRHRGGTWWGLLLGLVYIATGIFIFLNPTAGLRSLTLLLGAYLLVEAGLVFSLAFSSHAHKGRGWLMFDGLVALILGFIVLLTWPGSALWVIGTLVGISMIFNGVSRLMLAMAAHNVNNAVEEAHAH
jgi:uncharacterized membrane protein HdeD (DUF308 family)